MFIVIFILITIFKFLILLNFQYEQYFSNLPKHEVYDFIIGKLSDIAILSQYSNCFDLFSVGSGSAGSYISSQLSKHKSNGENLKILLLEAGSAGNSDYLFNIPVAQPMLLRSQYDWKYEIEPQKYACFAFNDNKCNWSAGKILGGSHRLNNMIYHRGTLTDYEHLIPLHEAERLIANYEKNSKITKTKFKTAVADAFVEGGKSLDLDFEYTNLTYNDRFRFTHASHVSENCDVVTNAIVSRIIFAAENPSRAIGVEFDKMNKLHSVYGKRIVISGGTIGSSKILLLSGIGPREHLTSMGIDVRLDLPVGKNLQDHITAGMDLILLNQTSGSSITNLISPINFFDYFIMRNEDNIFTFSGCDAMGFAKLDEAQTRPDLSFMLIPTSIKSDYGIQLKGLFNLKNEVWEEEFENLKAESISILPILLKPKSRGYVKLRSRNYMDPPIIDPNYLADKDDLKKLISGISIIHHLVDTPQLRKFGAELNPKKIKRCENFESNSFSYWKCYIKHFTMSVFHPTGKLNTK